MGMKDFRGFRFGNIHTQDLHLEVVSSSSRYPKNLLPTSADVTVDVPGGNGQYYFGSTFKPREFKINIAFDNISEELWRTISKVFSSDKLQDLVFDENPYKTYRAKIKVAPEFKFVCFHDRDTKQRIYKGEGSLNFICYHPLAYCFNKYIVRAADYYTCLTPQQIIEHGSLDINSVDYDEYSVAAPRKMLTGLIKDHYNWESFLHENECNGERDKLLDPQEKYPNMNGGWPGGYPTIEQVQKGELFFKKDGEEKTIIDVRGYWNNIPEWESTAKLLTTPTLDYDQELIYLPQYSKTNYYNMETGLNKQNSLIGSRLLVYNPGDIPVDFKLHLKNFDYQKMRGVLNSKNPDYLKFRISRYNVQRLTLDQAIDWTGLKTYNKDDNAAYKYGAKYFTILQKQTNPNSIDILPKELKMSHPNHAYIVEPIPSDKLSNFIKMFYWQSYGQYDEKGSSEKGNLYRKGLKIAKHYQELYNECINDTERYELYWETLKQCIFSQYSKDYSDLFYDYIHRPLEYLRDISKNYGQFQFDNTHIPQYMTYDYLDINTNNFDKITTSGINQPTLTLDSECRMLYNIITAVGRNTGDYQYDDTTTKLLFNDNIKKGHWFKIPPGWSLIDISPLVTEDIWGGKRWIDGRKPFIWGETNENERIKFEKIYRLAAARYLYEKGKITSQEADEIKNIDGLPLDEVDKKLEFRKWNEGFENYTLESKGFKAETFISKWQRDEYGFLKTLADYWRIYNSDEDGQISLDIDSWWWKANNYIWDNYPPLYWGYADLFNNATIEYVPQFY